MKKIFIFVVLAFSTFFVGNQSVFGLQNNPPPSLVTQHPIAGKPLNIVVEVPGRLWFTMPEENAVGSLVFDAAGTPTFTSYPVPTADSEPYDLVYDATNQLIWFSQRSAARIGRLDIATGDVTEPVVLAADSQPAGIALAPNGFLWFVESNANKLASYDPAAQKLEEFDYAPFNITGNANLEDVAIADDDSIWFTAPKDSEVVQFVPSNQRFFRSFFKSQLGTDEPFSITIGQAGRTWVTDVGTNRIAEYSPGTLTFWARYALNSEDSMPLGIAFDDHSARDHIVISQSESGRLARLDTLSDTANKPLELPLGETSKPHGIAIDGEGSIWVADFGASAISQWNRPFYHTNYLPMIQQTTVE